MFFISIYFVQTVKDYPDNVAAVCFDNKINLPGDFGPDRPLKYTCIVQKLLTYDLQSNGSHDAEVNFMTTVSEHFIDIFYEKDTKIVPEI